ncbi:MAG TPA: hypothetical protein DD418_18020 [Pseudomonas sp.]|nr:hypothetical protein [Pseudomonas sp.]
MPACSRVNPLLHGHIPVGAGLPAKRPRQAVHICEQNYQIHLSINRFFRICKRLIIGGLCISIAYREPSA